MDNVNTKRHSSMTIKTALYSKLRIIAAHRQQSMGDLMDQIVGVFEKSQGNRLYKPVVKKVVRNGLAHTG